MLGGGRLCAAATPGASSRSADGPQPTPARAPGSDVDDGASCSVADPGSLATTVTCTDDGAFTATLTVDEGEQARSATTQITVVNVAPAVDAPGIEGSVPGESVLVSAGFTDPGANDTHTCSVDFGDGTAPRPARWRTIGARPRTLRARGRLRRRAHRARRRGRDGGSARADDQAQIGASCQSATPAWAKVARASGRWRPSSSSSPGHCPATSRSARAARMKRPSPGRTTWPSTAS